MNCEINPHILRYIEMVESGEIISCELQQLLVAHVRKCFETEDIYTDDTLLENYLKLVKYFPYERLFEWEEFIFALHNCTFRKHDNRPRWPDLFCLIGRGAGKDGYLAFDSFAMVSPYNPIKGYDVDICANNEEQALTPLRDVTAVLNDPANIKKLKKHFYWTKELVTGLKRGSTVRGRTNSPKGKDGLRTGKMSLNEIHQYENYDNINVFTTGLGKRMHPRRTFMTTDGDVRDGPLDDLKEKGESILRGDAPDNGMLPFMCRLDDKDEVHDPANWPKANPSLPYRPDLFEEIRKEYVDWKERPETLPAFMTKRMNCPEGNAEMQVASYESIQTTKHELPSLKGWECVLGIDYVKTTDFASVNAHFRSGDLRYDINHSWLCLASADLGRIKAPWKEWAKQGKLTLVDDVEIHPALICNYITDLGRVYQIQKVALDDYRYALLASYLEDIGFDASNRKNIKLVRPSDIMKVVPVIESCFAQEYFRWGDAPVLRWAANNTKKVRSGKKLGTDTGNYYYAKIEGRSRKTDPFMALVACMVIEDELSAGGSSGSMMPPMVF